MATTIKLKNSVTTTNAPSSLAQGEVAINVTDKKVWVGNAATTPVQLLGTGASGNFSALTVTSLTDSGNLTFTGTGNRITGDFNNGTVTNKVIFQTSTANSPTTLSVAPSGSSPDSYYDAWHVSSGFTNTAYARFGTDGSLVRVESSIVGSGTYLPLTMYTGGSERLRIDTSGNVGIGTSSPSTRLDVGSSSAIVSKFSSTQSQVFLQMVPTSGAVGYVGVDASNVFMASSVGTTGIKFKVALSAPDNSATIDSSGNLLVGTTTASSGSAGHIQAGTGINAKAGSSGAYGGNLYNINWTGSPQLWIDTTNVGTITVVSDYRIKRNVETQRLPALERVMALRPVTYQIADYGNLFTASDDIKEGFIAHEVQEVIPSGAEGVKDDENQIQSLRVDAILAVAVKAIQEQQAIITDLKTRIEALENK